MTKYVIAALVCVLCALACAFQGAYGGVAVWLSLGVVALGFGSAAKARGVRLEHDALRRRADAEHEAFLNRYMGDAQQTPYVKWKDEQ